jgi:tetratricopeptide (TPR) repeat protein
MCAKLTNVMGFALRFLNCTVAALLAIGVFSLPALAVNDVKLDQYFEELIGSDANNAARVAKEIELEWTKSGSSAMDLLLKRGRDALDAGEIRTAIEHLTALTDHAPDFAEGWHMRSLAYFHQGLYGPAVSDIERALALEPRHFNAIASLGAILAEIDRLELAKEAFEQVLAIHPHHQDVIEALESVTRQIGGAEL